MFPDAQNYVKLFTAEGEVDLLLVHKHIIAHTLSFYRRAAALEIPVFYIFEFGLIA